MRVKIKQKKIADHNSCLKILVIYLLYFDNFMLIVSQDLIKSKKIEFILLNLNLKYGVVYGTV